MNEADAMRFFSVEALTGERVAAHLAHANGVVELRNDNGAGDTDAHLCNRKKGIVAAITISQAAIIPVPPPKQAPCTSATVGIGSILSRWIVSAVMREACKLSCGDERRTVSSQLMSAPA